MHEVIQNATNFCDGGPYYLQEYLFNFYLVEENRIVGNDEEAYDEHKNYHQNKEKMDKKFNKRIAKMDQRFIKFEQRRHEKLNIEYRKPSSLKIDDYLERNRFIHYEYDFADGWQFNIYLEEVVDDYHFGYPILLDGANDSPVKGIGGMDNFYNFLEAYKNPNHMFHLRAIDYSEGNYF